MWVLQIEYQIYVISGTLKLKYWVIAMSKHRWRFTTIIIFIRNFVYIVLIRGCSNFCIFLRTELQVPYILGNTAVKFQRKIMTATPRQANAILCLHLNNSTSKLRSNTWLSPTRFLNLNDCFHLFYDKSNKLLRYSEFSILL